MKRQKKQNANLMMIDYLISNTIAQNVVLILMAIQKLFVTLVTRVNREYLKDFVLAFFLSIIIIFILLAVGEWKLRSMM